MRVAEDFPLGKARLDLEVNLEEFVRNMRKGRSEGDQMQANLDALAAVSEIAEAALGRVKMGPRQAAESDASASAILEGVRGISDESRSAAEHLDKVRLTESQATESTFAGERIKRNVKDIGDEADRTKRKLAEVRLAGGRNGVGVGPFGSGFGRVGLLGAAIGAGVLTAPAAGPGMLGLAGASVGLLGGLAGAAGTLALAFDGVAKAIGGDKKAFDRLNPVAQQFVETVRSLSGWVDKLKETAGQNLFPGLTEALHSALTPGTVNAISVAVAALAHALGLAGEEWGKYFGSPEFQSIFGPMMQEAARNIGQLADTALHLFDALGVLSRAAIPLTDWLMKAIDDGSKLADNWLHAKDASGQLSGAMKEAQQSLQLVGRLGESLLKVIAALGAALYPVSKIAVKDLTDGLNALADIIQRNQGTIREIVEGALAALVSTVHALTPIVVALAKALGFVVQEIGGWKTAFEIVIGGYLALKFVALAGSVGEFVTQIGLARVALLALSAPEVLASIGIVGGALYGLLKLMNGGATQSTVTNASGVPTGTIINEHGKKYFAPLGQRGRKVPIADAIAAGLVPTDVGMANPSKAGMLAGMSTPYGQHAAKSGTRYSQSQVYQLLIANGVPSDVAANLALISAKGEDPSGNIAALNNNPSTGDYSVGLFQENFLGQMGRNRVAKYAPMFGLNPNMSTAAFAKWLGQHPSAQAKIAFDIYSSQGYGAWTTAAGLGISDQGSPFGTPPPFTTGLGSKPPKPPVIPPAATRAQQLASTNAAQARALGNVGGTAKRYLDNELADLKTAQKLIDAKLKTAHGKDAAELEAAATRIGNQIIEVQALIKKSVLITGDKLLPPALRAKLTGLSKKFTADSAYAAVLTGDAAERYQATLRTDLQDQAKVLEQERAVLQRKLKSTTGKQRDAVKAELDKVNQHLGDVQDQVLQSLQSMVQTIQGHTSTYLTSVLSEIDAAFEAKTQALVDQLGVKYFQNGALTPEEQAYQAMLDADRTKQLQDALKNATTPEELAAAQHQIDLENASEAATASRTRADQAYADAVKDLTAQRTALESSMNAQLAKLGDGLLNGTNSVNDLAAVASEFGVKITNDTVPDFDNLATSASDLQAALEKLSDYIDQLTGTTPSAIPTTYLGGHLADALAAGTPTLKVPSAPPIPAVPQSSTAMGTRGLAPSPTSQGGDIVLQVDGHEIARTSIAHLDGPLAGVAARKLNAHLDREKQATL